MCLGTCRVIVVVVRCGRAVIVEVKRRNCLNFGKVERGHVIMSDFELTWRNLYYFRSLLFSFGHTLISFFFLFSFFLTKDLLLLTDFHHHHLKTLPMYHENRTYEPR